MDLYRSNLGLVESRATQTGFGSAWAGHSGRKIGCVLKEQSPEHLPEREEKGMQGVWESLEEVVGWKSELGEVPQMNPVLWVRSL